MDLGLATVSTTLAGPDRIDPRAGELEQQRSRARGGTSVERIIVTADSARCLDSDVRELLSLDAGAGVRTQLLDASSALPPDLDLPLPLAMWDGSRAQVGETEFEAPDRVARVSAAFESLRSALPRDELVLPEPLLLLAGVARAAAPVLCEGCAPYHGLIEDLRLVDLIDAPRRFGDFFRDALDPLAKRSRARVLVAGAADGGLLSLVLSACERAGSEGAVTVIDRCPTALLLNRVMADHERARIATLKADVTVDPPAGPFDAIVTDSMLTLLSHDGRARALAGWRASLAPGGRLITTLRIEPEADGTAESVDEEARAAFAAMARSAAEVRAPLLELTPAELEARAHTFAGSVKVSPVASVPELEALLREAGLEIEDLQLRHSAGLGKRAVAGPSARRPATRAVVIARHR